MTSALPPLVFDSGDANWARAYGSRRVDPASGPEDPFAFVEIVRAYDRPAAGTFAPFDARGDGPWLYPVRLDGPGRRWMRAGSWYRPRTFLDLIPGRVLDAVRAGRGTLLLDNSFEPIAASWRWFAPLHRALARHRIDPRRVVLLAQNPGAGAAALAWAEAHDERRPVKVIGFQQALLLCAARYRGRRAGDATGLADGDAMDPRSATYRMPERALLALNHRDRPHRLALALHVLEATHEDRIYLSSAHRPDRRRARRFFRHLYGDDGAARARAMATYRRFAARFPLSLDIDFASGGVRDFIGDVPGDLIERSAFAIVTETEFEQDDVRRLTEKTWKAVANFHPFLMAGVAGLLDDFHALGFRSFAPALDERYDEERDPARRLAMILAEVDRLCALTPQALDRLRTDLWPVVAHNERQLYAVAPAVYDRFRDDLAAAIAGD